MIHPRSAVVQSIAWQTNRQVLIAVTEAANGLEPPNWAPIMTNTIGINLVPVVDTNAASSPRRFYRLVSPGL